MVLSQAPSSNVQCSIFHVEGRETGIRNLASTAQLGCERIKYPCGSYLVEFQEVDGVAAVEPS